MKKRSKLIVALLAMCCLAVPVLVGTVKSKAAEDLTNTYVVETYTADDARAYFTGDTAPDCKTEGYIFAGWYAETDTIVDGYFAGEPLTTVTGYTGNVQALFVDEAVLGVKAQIAVLDTDTNTAVAEVTSDSETGKSNVNIRFVTSVDTLKYQKVGVKVSYTYNGEERERDQATKKVYGTLLVADGNGENDAKMVAPDEIFSTRSQYFKAYTMTGFPMDAFETELSVSTYWVTADGATVYGSETPVVKTVQQGIHHTYEANIDNTYYKVLEDAVASIDDTDTKTVTVIKDAEVENAMTIAGNVTLTNMAGKNVTITRNLTNADMFTVASGSSLTIQGTTDNTITIDGNKAGLSSAVGKTMIANKGTFTLGENASLVNANGTGAGPALRNYTGATATLSGTVSNNETTNNGGAIYNNGGTLNITGGIYQDNKANGDAKNGGLINNNAGGDITISDGTFTGNTATGRGGAINNSAADGVITITGGTFTGNSADNTGGVLSSFDEAIVRVSGCNMISDTSSNTSGYPNCDIVIRKDSTLEVGGDANIGVVYLENATSKLAITATLTEQMTVILPAYEEGQTVVTSFGSEVDASASVSQMTVRKYDDDKSTYRDNVYYVDLEGKLQIVEAMIGEVPYLTLLEAFENVQNGETIVVNKDVALDTAVTISDKNITLTNKAGKNVTITRNQTEEDMFTVASGSSLTIQGTADNTITIDGNKDCLSSAVKYTMIANNGTFTLGENASLVNAKGTGAGPALRNYEGATAILSGTVSNNETTNNGGAIYNNGGTLNITGGTFSGNAANGSSKHGGLIHGKGTITISGGTFTGNTASGNGGVVSSTSGDITITGGSITDNTANKGGGIYYYSGTLSVSNCTITGNSSTALDCDIWALKDGSLELGALNEDSEMAVVHLERPSATIKLTSPLTSEMIVIIGAAHATATNNFEVGDQVIDSSGDLTSVGMIKVHYRTTEGINDTDYYIDSEGKLQTTN